MPKPERTGDALDAESAGRLWQSLVSGCAPPEQGPNLLVPFDDFAVLFGSEAINDHLEVRRRRFPRARFEWTEIVSWPLSSDAVLMIAHQTVRCADRDSGEEAERHHRVMALIERASGSWRLAHVTEAAPAFLPLVIERYKADAAAWRTG